MDKTLSVNSSPFKPFVRTKSPTIGCGAHGSIRVADDDDACVIKTIRLFEIDVVKKSVSSSKTSNPRVYIADGYLPELVALERLRCTNARHVLNFEYDVTRSALNLRMKRLKPLEVTNLDASTARRYTRQLFEAVSDMHNSGIVHGDIKLSNLMVDDEGYDDNNDDKKLLLEKKHCHRNLFVIDYGLSKVDFGPLTLDHTLYTAGYKSPEILFKQHDFDPKKADVWAAGVCAASFMLGIDCGQLLCGDSRVPDVPNWLNMLRLALRFIGKNDDEIKLDEQMLSTTISSSYDGRRLKLYKMVSTTKLLSSLSSSIYRTTINDIETKMGREAKEFVASAMDVPASRRPTAADLLFKYSSMFDDGGDKRRQHVLAPCSTPSYLATVNNTIVDVVNNAARMLTIESKESVIFKTLSVIDALIPLNLAVFRKRRSLMIAGAFAVSVSLCEPKLMSVNRIASAYDIGDVSKLKFAIYAVLREKTAIAALATPSAFDAAAYLFEIASAGNVSVKICSAELASELIAIHAARGKLTPLGIVALVSKCAQRFLK